MINIHSMFTIENKDLQDDITKKITEDITKKITEEITKKIIEDITKTNENINKLEAELSLYRRDYSGTVRMMNHNAFIGRGRNQKITDLDIKITEIEKRLDNFDTKINTMEVNINILDKKIINHLRSNNEELLDIKAKIGIDTFNINEKIEELEVELNRLRSVDIEIPPSE